MNKFELIKCSVEPEDSLEIEVAEKGKLNIWLTVDGDSCHVVLTKDSVNKLKKQLDEAVGLSEQL
ncbi:hypothetical protein MLA2C4_11710 [Bacillus mobilis]|nr:hypothetical protein MLA2C4_11710 [Bacillus mobilis]